MNNSIKSPLRYPGGKSKAVSRLIKLTPSFEEYREPMVGGGSFFFALKQEYPNKKYWLNDKNTDLYLFWKKCRDSPEKLKSKIVSLKHEFSSGKELYSELVSNKFYAPLSRAARFFILNRITFSGLTESGGYSEQAFLHRFTDSSIDRVLEASKILQGVRLTNVDYSKLLRSHGSDVFIFLDPPYYSKMNSKLYGKKGNLHTKFDHLKFFDDIKHCNHNCLVTYDNCAKINDLFDSTINLPIWNKYDWQLNYSMHNKNSFEQEKNELFISNYSSNHFETQLV